MTTKEATTILLEASADHLEALARSYRALAATGPLAKDAKPLLEDFERIAAGTHHEAKEFRELVERMAQAEASG